MTVQCHEVKRFENLMYEGCEPHWHCIHCGDYWPFHCYGRKDLEQMECPARNKLLAYCSRCGCEVEIGQDLCKKCLYEVQAEMEEHERMYEPTYNQEDGSM